VRSALVNFHSNGYACAVHLLRQLGAIREPRVPDSGPRRWKLLSHLGTEFNG